MRKWRLVTTGTKFQKVVIDVNGDCFDLCQRCRLALSSVIIQFTSFFNTHLRAWSRSVASVVSSEARAGLVQASFYVSHD